MISLAQPKSRADTRPNAGDQSQFLKGADFIVDKPHLGAPGSMNSHLAEDLERASIKGYRCALRRLSLTLQPACIRDSGTVEGSGRWAPRLSLTRKSD